MLLHNVRFLGDDFAFHTGDIRIENGYFRSLEIHDAPPATNSVIVPGMVDIHLHGNSNLDFSDGRYESLAIIARHLATVGTTSFSATSLTLPEERLLTAYQTAARFREDAPPTSARLIGITMEGPFFSEAKKGAHEARYLKKPDIASLKRLQAASADLLRITCVAPELEGALDYIHEAKSLGLLVAAAHTNANYEEASLGFAAGIEHVTHLFNAMPPLLHREPGLIGAAAERDYVTVELIGDGIHVHESAVRAAFKLFGPERICLISDAIPAAGLEEGETSLLGDKRITVRNGCAVLDDGTIAGSIASLLECAQRVIRMGIAPENVFRTATYNPAIVMEREDLGVIAVGKRADFLVLNASDYTLQEVYIDGKRV